MATNQQELRLKIISDNTGLLSLGKEIQAISDKVDKELANEYKIIALEKEKENLWVAQVKSMNNILNAQLDQANKERSLLNLAEQHNKALRERSALINGLKSFDLNNANLAVTQAKTPTTVPTGFNFATGGVATVTSRAAEIDATTIQKSYNYVKQSVSEARAEADRLAASFKSAAVDATTLARTAIPKGFNYATGGVNTQAVKEITSEQAKVKESSEKVKESITGQISAWNRLKNGLAGIIVEYRAINAVYNLILDGLRAVPRGGIQLEATLSSLTATFGNITAAQRELAFLNQEANRTGISISTLRESYQSAAASFIAAGESAETTRKIFQNINTVATTLHLSSDRVSGVYLALSQIFNKTKLQAEELTKQLAQTIPGVTNQQAAALSITVSELYDRMKKGAVSAHDAVLALSEELAKTFGGDAFTRAASGLNSELGRLSTAWTHLAENVYKASAEMLISVVKFTTGSTQGLVEASDNTEKFQQSVKSMVIELTAAVAAYTIYKIATIAIANETLKAAKAATNFEIALGSLKSMAKSGLFTAAIAEIGIFAGKLTAVQLRMQELSQEAADFRRQQNAKTVEDQKQYTVDSDPNVKALTTKVEEAKKQYEKYNKGLFGGLSRASAEEIQSTYTTYNALTEKLAAERKKVAADFDASNKLTTEKKAPFVLTQQDLTQDKRMQTEFLKNKKEFAKLVDLQYKDEEEALQLRLEKGDQTAKEQLNILQENKKAALASVQEKDAKKGLSENLKLVKDNYKDLSDESDKYSKKLAGEIKDLDSLYKFQAISIEDYFKQKEELQLKDLNKQIEIATQQKAIAEKFGDTTKVDDFSRKIVAGYDRIKEAQDAIANSKLEEQFKFNDMLRTVELDYQKFTNDTAGLQAANLSEINTKYKSIEIELISLIEKGSSFAKTALEHVKAVKADELAMKNLASSQEKLNLYSSILKDKEESIRNAREIGLLSEQQATQQLIDARNEYTNIAKKELDITYEIALANKDNAKVMLEFYRQKKAYETNAYPQIGAADKVINSSYNGTFSSQIDQIRNGLTTLDNLKAGKEQADKQAADQAQYGLIYKSQADAHQAMLDQQAENTKKFSDATLITYGSMFDGILSMGAIATDGLTKQMIAMHGANSKEAKKAFLLHKALAAGQIMISTAAGAMKAYEQTGIYGVIGAGLIVAQGAVELAQVLSQPMPAAHGGLDYVPKEQTYLLDKGERVLSPKQNKDLTNFMQQGNIGKDNSSNKTGNIRIINSIDPSVFHEYLGTDEGEKVVMNIVRRNRETA